MTRDRYSLLWSALIVLGCALVLTFASPEVAYADDCTRDPFNAADCMRTNGFRETIAVIVSLGGSITVILVNVLSGIPITTPPPAAPPREITLTDAAGREHHYEWSEEHQGYVNILTGGVLDPTLWDEYNRNLQENIRFTEEQHQKLESRQTDFDRQMDQMVEEHRQEMERLRQEQSRQRMERNRAEIETRIREALEEAKKYSSFAKGADKVLTVLEWVKWGADAAIDVCAQLSPGTGKLIKAAYKFASGVGEGIGEGMADPAKFVSHVIKGAARGGIDVGTDAMKDAIGEKLLRHLPENIGSRPIISDYRISKDYGYDLGKEIPDIDISKAMVNVTNERLRNFVNPIVWTSDSLKDLIGK